MNSFIICGMRVAVFFKGIPLFDPPFALKQDFFVIENLFSHLHVLCL